MDYKTEIKDRHIRLQTVYVKEIIYQRMSDKEIFIEEWRKKKELGENPKVQIRNLVNSAITDTWLEIKIEEENDFYRKRSGDTLCEFDEFRFKPEEWFNHSSFYYKKNCHFLWIKYISFNITPKTSFGTKFKV